MSNNRKTLQSGKFWVGLISVIVVIAILFSLFVWRTGGFKDWTFGFGEKDSTQTEQPQTEKTGGELKITVPDDSASHASKMSLEVQPMSASPDEVAAQADEPIYTITATVRDSVGDALPEIQQIKATMAWSKAKNEAVTDYVEMTLTGTTASFKCLNPFDTEITVTFISEINENVTATAVLNYVNRIDAVNFQWKGETQTVQVGGTANIVLDPYWNENESSPFMTRGIRFVNMNYGFGSKYAEGESVCPNVYAKIKLSQSFIDYITSHSGFYNLTKSANIRAGEGGFVFTRTLGGFIPRKEMLIDYTKEYSERDIIFGLFTLHSGEDDEWCTIDSTAREQFLQAIKETENQFELLLDFGGSHTQTFTINATVRATSVSSLETDKTEINF